MIDINIAYLANDELLSYIVDREFYLASTSVAGAVLNRSSHLRRLTLAICDEISETTLAEAVRKLPQLEELHLIMVQSVHAKDVETIGISCPLLKSFTFNDYWRKHSEYSDFSEDEETHGQCCNEYALAIGKTMPNLRHLRLVANRMKNEGLQAVLDGCPHLESLDLRQCFGLDLHGVLGKKCSEQIKDLKGPSDPISGSECSTSESFDVDCGVSMSSLYGFSDDCDYSYDFDCYEGDDYL